MRFDNEVLEPQLKSARHVLEREQAAADILKRSLDEMRVKLIIQNQKFSIVLLKFIRNLHKINLMFYC